MTLGGGIPNSFSTDKTNAHEVFRVFADNRAASQLQISCQFDMSLIRVFIMD
jgi:hypothetical protein